MDPSTKKTTVKTFEILTGIALLLFAGSLTGFLKTHGATFRTFEALLVISPVVLFVCSLITVVLGWKHNTIAKVLGTIGMLVAIIFCSFVGLLVLAFSSGSWDF
jgi:hypothetical protein